jgi:hypothetical protein
LRGGRGVLTATGDIGQIPFVDEEMQSLASSLMRGVTSRGGFNYWDKRALKVPSRSLAHTHELTLTHTLTHTHTHTQLRAGDHRVKLSSVRSSSEEAAWHINEALGCDHIEMELAWYA